MPSSLTAPVVGIGEILWDLLPAGPRLGGATTNFSVLSAHLGEPAALVSRLGTDSFGTQARERLASLVAGARFDLGPLQTSTTLPTGTVTVTLDAEGRPHYIIDAPVAWDEITLTPDLLVLAANASTVCYGTLAQRMPVSRNTLRAFVEAVTPDCISVCDVNLRMPFCTAEIAHWSVLHATVLKVSDEEMVQLSTLLTDVGLLAAPFPPAACDPATLTGWATESAHALLAAAPGCKLVAITLGPHGSLLVDRHGSHRHDGFPVKVADTIGAGDAFTAGLVHAYRRHDILERSDTLERSNTLERINTVANLCGSYVAGQQGATPAFPADLLATIQTALT